jgi:D-alanine transaminase
MSICYLNGEFMPLKDAKISVMDRAFIFGDSVYEVIPVKQGKVFAAEEHIARLARSLAAIQLENPYPEADWIALFDRLLEENNDERQSIYVQVTRGPGVRDHVFPAEVQPTVLVALQPGREYSDLTRVNAVTSEDIRWLRCDIKSTSLLANVLLRNHAKAGNAYDAILVRGDYVTEGASTSVFVVKSRRVRTPPLSNLLLAGVTRGLLIRVLIQAGMDVAETNISLAELKRADEIWLASSTRDLLSVARLDGNIVGKDGQYPLAMQAHAHFQAYVAERQAG